MGLDSLWQDAVRKVQQGDLKAASAALSRLLAAAPDHVEALRLSGKIAHLAGQTTLARQLLGKASGIAPDHPELLYERGVVALDTKNWKEAAALFERQLARFPDHAGTRFNLAWVLKQTENVDRAIEQLTTLVAKVPGHGAGWFNLGNALLLRHRDKEALSAFLRALELSPDNLEAVANAVTAAARLGEFDTGRRLLEQCSGKQKSLWMWLAAKGELALAEGRKGEALDCFSRALEQNPAHQPSLLRLSQLYLGKGQLLQAAETLRHGLAHHPGDKELTLILAQTALAAGDCRQAIKLARSLVGAGPSAEACATLGKALALSGDLAGAIRAFRDGLRVDPDSHALHSNLLFALMHDEATSPEEVFLEHDAFGRYWESKFDDVPWQPAPEDTPERRLRIGYVSADFCEHAVTCFFAPLLDLHDREKFEIYCYHIPRKIDAVTAALRSKADHWRVLPLNNIPAAVRMIREDHIDILFDLGGHTAGNLLPMFAARPAPIQMSGIGYPGTTGLRRIQHRLAYGNAPKHADQADFSSEAVIRLPPLPFRPLSPLPPSGPLPAQRNGFVTFGSMGKYAKVGPKVRQVWAELLNAVANARLLVLVPGGGDPDVADSVGREFEQAGIARERLVVVGERPYEEWLDLFKAVDIVLDPFPYHGGTTSRLALQMGLPVIRLHEGKNVETAGAFLCGSHAAYVATAARLARSIDDLAARRMSQGALQATLSQQRTTAFVCHLEDAFRSLWVEYLIPFRQ